MKFALVLGMLVTMVLGKSIDNPAENPARPGGMQMAVPTVVESTKRESKSLAVPPPVQVTSGVVTVLGDARKGRVIEIGDDGIPIIHGVRSPDDPTDTKVYRNARIVNNVLITPEDEVRMNGIKGRSLTDSSNKDEVSGRSLTDSSKKDEVPKGRTGRILSDNASNGDGTSSSWIFKDSRPQVVSYSYLAAPNGNSRNDASTKSPPNVVYGTGSAPKPPSQSASASVSFESVKTSSQSASKFSSPVAQQQQSFQPSLNVISSSSSNEISTSISNAEPFGHQTTPPESFAVHQVAPNAKPQFPRQHFTHPPHAPPTVIAADHNNFIIKDTTFQAHPGAPTFSLPIPIPTQQVKPIRRRPFNRNQIQASSGLVHHAVPATGDLSYTSYNPHDIPFEPSTKKPIYKKMMEPFMKAGEKIYEMASPVFDPMINAGQKISNSLGFKNRDPFNMNDYISRTTGEATVPIVAGVALAALAFGTLAAVVSSNITIGKHSVEDPLQEFMYQVLDPYPMGEPTLLDHLEEYTTWTDSKCSKRIFCDVMSNIGDDTLYAIEKRLDMFLRLLNRGSSEESNLKQTADDVMQAVYRRDCHVFSCRGNSVDTSQVPRLASSGPR